MPAAAVAWMSILVTGGAGYIGSHVVHQLVHEHKDVVVIDDLSGGKRSNVRSDIPFLKAYVGDRSSVPWFLRRHRVSAILHIAARARKDESIVIPRTTYAGNLVPGI